jgi:hypothetical protein
MPKLLQKTGSGDSLRDIDGANKARGVDDDDDDEDDDDDDDDIDEDDESNETDDDSLSDLVRMIMKVRKCVSSTFRHSPVKNDALQREVAKELGREVALAKDMPTRWNSLLPMLKSFLKVKKPLLKIMAELSINITFTENDFEAVQDLITALEPVELASKKLCRRDATLLSSEGILRFHFNELQSYRGSVHIPYQYTVSCLQEGWTGG